MKKRITAPREVLHELQQDYFICTKCKVCQAVHVQFCPESRFWRNCPSGTRFRWDAYYASGKMELARGLHTKELAPNEVMRDILYACNLCSSCQEQCYEVKQLLPTRVFELMREKAVAEGWGPMPEHKKLAESLEKNDNPFGEHLYLAGSQAWIAQYLAIYDRAKHVPEASQIAEKIMNYNMFKMNYNEESGRFRFGGPGVGAGKIQGKCAHFHTHAMNILGCLYVAMQTGNQKLLDRGLKAYEWGKSKSDNRVGFFPMVTYDEYVGAQTAETCEVADMIIAGLTLSKMGIDRWDDVDRWTRNQLAENQITWNDWITDGHLDRSSVSLTLPKGEYTTENAAYRALGSFAGWPAPNDFVGSGDWGIGKDPITLTVMNCCTGSGARALFAVWRDMLSFQNGELRINLLLNRASKWAEIGSYIPYSGRVDVKVKQPVNLSIRIPEWVIPEEVKVEVDGEARTVSFDGRYAQTGKVNKGQAVVMTFPISERTEKRTIEGFDYTFIIRGNDVVSVSPQGKYCPMYQRGHYRTGKTLYNKVTRFISDEEYEWW